MGQIQLFYKNKMHNLRIDKETWKIGTDHNKLEKIIKYMPAQHKKHLLEKKNPFSSNIKESTAFFYGW